MGFLEAKGQEEGLLRLGFRMLLERGNGQVGLESVDVSVIRHIGRLVGRSIEQAAGRACPWPPFARLVQSS